uniref:Uncharacterized protein n=1 Tax=Anopheles funestus TaxID=62324 RepID=A0A182S3Z6_ANOFN
MLLQLINFETSTFDRATIKHLPPALDELEIINSKSLQRFVLPSNLTIRRIALIKTQLSKIELQCNDVILQLFIVGSKLQKIPVSLRNLKNLLNFKLQQSYIHHLNLDLLQWFNQLDSLELMQNRIQSITSTLNHRQQRKFDMLNLSNNQLRIINLEVALPIGWFKNVNLSYNKLELLVGRFPGGHLQNLMLSHNRLKTLDFCQWELMPSLETIALDSNQLLRLPNCMHQLPGIYNICFSKNNLTSVNMDAFSDMEDLLDLDLSSNHISLITFREEKYPKRLVELILSNNKIECNNPGDLPFCPLDIEFLPSSPNSAWSRNNNSLQRQLTITTA